MSKLSRWLFLILALFLLVMLPTKTAFASEPVKEEVVLPPTTPPTDPNGGVVDNANSNNSGSSSNQQVAGGDAINEARMGYVIWLSDGSGTSLNGKVSFITATGSAPSVPSGRPVQNYLATRFGQVANDFVSQTPPWGTSPMASGGISNEPIMTAFMKSPYETYDFGAFYVADKILGYTPEQVAQLIETYKDDLYLNVQPFVIAGVYGSTADSHSGMVIAGSCIGWSLVAEPNNYLNRYTHNAINNSHFYDNAWLNLSIPTVTTGSHSNATIQSPIGLGIVSYKLVEGDKDVIKTYYTSGVLDKTSYGKGESPIPVKDEGSYIVKEWFTSKTRTKLTGNQEYPTFESELSPKVQSGSGTSTVTMPEIEKTIVIKLEREEIPMVATSADDVIYSHELNIVSPFLADYHRLDNPASINNLVKFKLTESEAETIVTDGYSGSGTISNIEIKDDRNTYKKRLDPTLTVSHFFL